MSDVGRRFRSLFVCGSLTVTFVAGAVARSQDAKPGATAWDGVYTVEQAERGRALYMDVCAACHGKDLRGDSTAPSLIEESFSFQWDGTTVGELFTRIRMFMPSDRPNSLSSQRYRDIVAFILQANKFPAGERALADEAEILQQIRITAKRP